jgi:hypothetical protein
MYNKFALCLAAAMGLTALVATTLAQDGADQKAATLSGDQLLNSDKSPLADIAPRAFTFTGQGRHGVTSEEARLSIEASQLAQQLGQAKTDGDKERLKTKFTDVLEKQFDQRQRRHESEIEALEAQVKKLKDLVRLRSEKRREIVAKRLEQALRDAEGLGW